MKYNLWYRRNIIATLGLVLLITISFAPKAESQSTAPTVETPQVQARSVVIPSFRDPQRRLEKPDLAGLSFIRFLTTADFPPFNYIAPGDRIVGFNIDLARALCDMLDVTCVVQIRPWESLAETTAASRENATIAAVAITEETRKLYDFTNRYLTTPARFAVRSLGTPPPLTRAGLATKTIGVVNGSAHERFIATYFPQSRRLAYGDAGKALAALKDSLIDIVFADGITLAFWMHGEAAEGCCAFTGGPYQESAFFGEGLAIGVAPGNDVLRSALNFALDRVNDTGQFEEIYLRHFPVSIY